MINTNFEIEPPRIINFISPGEFLRARWVYLKKIGVYRSMHSLGDHLGYTSRVSVYNILNMAVNIDVNLIDIYQKAFKLSKKETDILTLLISLHRSTTEIEELALKREIKRRYYFKRGKSSSKVKFMKRGCSAKFNY